MTEQERKQRMWDNLSPEARNMVLQVDPDFTPEKFPTPVDNAEFITVKGFRADYVYRTVCDPYGMLLKQELYECIPHEGYYLFDVAGFYLGMKTKPFVRKYFLAENKKDAKQQYENLYGWKAQSCEKIIDPKTIDVVLHNNLLMPLK